MCDMNVIETPFSCERNGLQIRGRQYVPGGEQKNKKYPVIIVSHGFTGNYISVEDYCRAFARMGYAAFGFNFCGGGRMDEDISFKSDGASTKSTIFTEVEDLIAVKDYVKELPFADGKNLILAGVSQGGLVSGLAAAKCKEEIKKLIMIYPALCIPDHARRGLLGGSRYDVNHVPEIIDCKVTRLGKVFHDSVVSMDVFLELSAYKGPVLILQGLKDEIVNYSYAIQAKETYEKGQCHLQLIRDAGHGFNKIQKNCAVASIKQFLLGHKELLTVRLIVTKKELVTDDGYRKSRIYFTGYCDTEYFHGTVLPGGCDTQEYDQEKLTKERAEYTLQGVDMEGEMCSLYVVNQKVGEEWKPVIETNSKNLLWLNNADLTAVLEESKEGPVVRIFGQLA